MASVTTVQIVALSNNVQAEVALLKKIASNITVDVYNPLNLFDVTADVSLVQEIKDAIVKGEAIAEEVAPLIPELEAEVKALGSGIATTVSEVKKSA